MTPTSAAIEARDLTKTYRKDVRALDGLGFRVEAGTVFVLLGPNGAGKSTADSYVDYLTPRIVVMTAAFAGGWSSSRSSPPSSR